MQLLMAVIEGELTRLIWNAVDRSNPKKSEALVTAPLTSLERGDESWRSGGYARPSGGGARIGWSGFLTHLHDRT